jgi:hypothetical protein
MLRIVGCVGALLLCFAPQARAETYRLHYEAAVLGVVVLGQADYEVTANPTRYGVRASLQTAGAARIFDQTQITAATGGTIAGSALTWSRYDLSDAYAGHKFRRVQLNHTGASVTSQVAPHYVDMGRPPASAAQQGASYDPLTAVFALGRQIGAARACTGSVLVFDGRSHYRLAVSPRGQGNFNGGGYNGPALTCVFTYTMIAGFSVAEQHAHIPQAEAIFALPAQASFAAPLRLTVPTPVGNAQLDVRTYQQLAN